MRYLLFSSILIAVFFTSCTGRFEEINTPEFEVSDDEIMGDNFKLGAFFPQMQEYVVPAQENAYQHAENLIGAVYARYMTGTKADWTQNNFAVCQVNDSWLNHPFTNGLAKIYSAWFEIRNLTGSKGPYFAWAQILRVASMHRLTDLYGPIPYSAVENGALNVPYDSQENAYYAMLRDLNVAITVLEEYVLRHPDARPMKQFDRVYAGDLRQWIKFANSLKLRMAMRIRFANEPLARKLAEEACNHPIGLIESNPDNATYKPVKSNPLYIMWNTFQDTRVCADIISYMDGYKDPRREKYFRKALINQNSGYWGLRAAAPVISDIQACSYSAPNVAAPDPLIWLTASEVAFLKAEAALLDWDIPGSAQQHYENGIRLSFDQWGVTGADAYIADNESRPADYIDPFGNYSTTAVGTIKILWLNWVGNEQKLARIITQKWIALWPLGHEAWCEYRRTGYPVLFSTVQILPISQKVANRIPFPPVEYSKNTENVQHAVKLLDGPDNYATPMWWDKYKDKTSIQNKK